MIEAILFAAFLVLYGVVVTNDIVRKQRGLPPGRFVLFSRYVPPGDRVRKFYVYCACKEYPTYGFPWSGPYLSEQEAKDEIADSWNLVGRHDSLYVVERSE